MRKSGYFRIYAGAAEDTDAICQGTAGASGDSPELRRSMKMTKEER